MQNEEVRLELWRNNKLIYREGTWGDKTLYEKLRKVMLGISDDVICVDCGIEFEVVLRRI